MSLLTLSLIFLVVGFCIGVYSLGKTVLTYPLMGLVLMFIAIATLFIHSLDCWVLDENKMLMCNYQTYGAFLLEFVFLALYSALFIYKIFMAGVGE